MGHLVELGKIIFRVEIFAECFLAPPDTYSKKVSERFKKFEKVSNSFKMFENDSED